MRTRIWLRRRLLIAWVMASTVIFLLGVFIWARAGISGQLEGTDFTTFYATSQVLLKEGPGRVYDLSLQRHAQAALFGARSLPFLPDPYPPFWILARFWLGLLPLGAAYLAWGLLTMAATALAVILLARSAGFEGRPAWPVLVVAGFPPAVVNLLQGQPVAFLLLGIALSIWLWGNGHEVLAGAALASLLIKPQLGVVLVGLVLIRRSLRVLGGLLLASAFLLATSLAGFGASGMKAWLRLLSADEGAVFRPWLSLRAPLVEFGLPALDQYLVLAVLAAVILILIAVARLDLLGAFGAATAGGLLIAPHVNIHDLTLLAVPGVLVAGTRRGLLVAGLGYLGAVAALWLTPAAWAAELALGGRAAWRRSDRDG